MKVLTVCMGDQGGTFFGETDLPQEEMDFAPPSPGGYSVSPLMKAEGVRILHTPAGYIDEWHPVPQRMFVIVLSGRVNLETSDGDSRIIETGGMFINNDVSGRGHRITEMDGKAYDMALVQLS